MKKASDFLVDSRLGEKSYELDKPPQKDEEKIVLAIDEGAVPVSVLREESTVKVRNASVEKSIISRVNDFVSSIGKPTPKEKAVFFRLLAIMINAGIPLIKSLDTISEQTTNRRLRRVIYELARDIERGGNLSGSMLRFPDIFNDAHIGVVKAGEASGQLNMILKQLAVEMEKNASIMRKVKGAMMYPAFIMLVMIGVVSGMMMFVVPKIAEIFLKSNQQLPMLTRVVIGISTFMSTQWMYILISVVAFVIAFIIFRKTRRGHRAVDWLLIHLPVFGQLLRRSILARFSRSLRSLLGSGVPIIQGLLINARGLGNDIYRTRVEMASEDIARGIPLAESLRDSPEFPSMMVQMIAVGEQTAQLDNISEKIAEYYEDEVDTAVASISKIIEPFIMVFIGVVVGGIVAAIMMPIIQMTQLSGAM